MEKTNQPGVYLRGGVGLPTVAPRSTSKVRQSVEEFIKQNKEWDLYKDINVKSGMIILCRK